MKEYFKKIYKDDCKSFYRLMKKNLKIEKKQFIVTANPEAFIMGERDEEFNKLLLDSDVTIVPDGIGIVKAGKMLNYGIKERITGVDICEELLIICNELKKSIYILGSKQEVIDKMLDVIKVKYPNVKIAGAQNGYSKDKDKDFKKIIKAEPDVVLVALGMVNQEKLIYKHLNKFKKGIFVGVGGSFDVISGMKKRAPKYIIKTNLEWLYRIIKEPKRIKRFINNNFVFFYTVIKNKKGLRNDEK